MGSGRTTAQFAHRLRSCVAFVVCAGPMCVGCRAQTAVSAQTSATAQASLGSGILTGTITDIDGRLVPGTKVVLTFTGGAERRAVADDNGDFRFAQLPAGEFKVTASADGFAPVFEVQVLHDGEDLELGAIVLATASSTTMVEVSKTREEIAEIELHQEEKQRLLGIVPNYFVSYKWDAQPLTVRQKFELDVKTLYDPVNIVINAGIAGVQQADDAFQGFHQGAAGYFKRFGANYADFAIGTTLGGAVLPSLFHQDPRYFYKGTGTKMQRALYALSTAVRQRGDNGKWQVAWSSMGGDIASGALSNLYYPASDRQGASLTLENGFLSIAFDGIGNLVQEFLFKPFSTGVPKK